MISTSYSSKSNGFTLIELSITLMLVAILAWMGLYGYSHLIQRDIHRQCAIQLLHDLAFAKLTAIQQNTTIILCASHNHQDCENTLEWGTGYIIIDEEHKIFMSREYAPNLSLSLRLYAGLHQPKVYFTPEGKSLYALHFQLPNQRIILPQTGRARLSL